MAQLLMQAESRDLSAFHACRHHYSAASECVRGPFVNHRARRSRPDGLRDRACHQPCSESRGVAGCPRTEG